MIDPGDLQAAIDAGVIDAATGDRLRAFFAAREGASVAPPPPSVRATPAPKFDVTHVLYYAGALLVMSAMGLFSNAAFNALGGYALAATALVYAIVFVGLGSYLWRSPELRVPAGLCIAVAVSMTPLAIYGVEDALGVWAADKPEKYRDFFPLINASWVYMEAGTILAAALALRFFPFPFILMIAAVAAWFMSMDLAALVVKHYGGDNWLGDWELRRRVSYCFGAVMILLAWALDLKWPRAGDFGFWLHLFGGLTFWGAISASSEALAIGQAAYCALNVLLIGFAIFINRRIYAVLGTIGVASYLGFLAFDVFKDALAFSFVVSLIGLGVIFLGVVYQRRQKAISAAIDAVLPRALRALRPQHST
ncbi:MAG TPA: hypothetical protein VEK35_01075 [Roseiarcus sp.]|nr:hypothetical protein [Roseiarcus sp.]